MSYVHKSSLHKKSLSIHVKMIIFIVLSLSLVYIFLPNLLPKLFTNSLGLLWKDQDTSISIPEEVENSTILALRRENRELKNILGRIEEETSSSTPEYVLAYVQRKPPYIAYDFFIIDQGFREGVEVGDRVYSVGSILIGEIVEVNTFSSKVKLYSSPGEEYEVSIGEDSVSSTAKGLGGGAFEIVLPRDIKIKEGEIVVSVEKNDSVIGVIRKVMYDPAKAFSTILFSQPVNIYEQKWLLVEKNTKQNEEKDII